MFERTFSFWKRLVGGAHPAAGATQVDRRVWARYPAEIKTSAQVNGKADPVRIPVLVRDISQGGANIEVDRSFPAGSMLNLELPLARESESHQVLACVVRATEDGPGRWSLGCVFSRELTHEDLEGFGAKKVRNDPKDNRIWQRFPCVLSARVQKVGAADHAEQEAQILNVSPSGVGLSVKEPVEAGTLLTVSLMHPAGKVVKTILACVVHVTVNAEGDCSLGCNFIRQLQEDEWQGLVHA